MSDDMMPCGHRAWRPERDDTGSRTSPAEMTVSCISGHRNPHVDDYRSVCINPLLIDRLEGDYSLEKRARQKPLSVFIRFRNSL